MSTVLCLSSQVARGYVGGTASRIALERMGHECWLLPTVVLSNHPGYQRFAGEQVPVGRLRAMLEALDANGWLGNVDAILLGYMPSAEHAVFAAGAVEMVRGANPEALCVCDPIIGDDPGGLYVDQDVAEAIRDTLLPLAAVATPNRFELEWLRGKASKVVGAVAKSARLLGPERVLVTSVMSKDPQTLANLLVNQDDGWIASVGRRKNAPHGAGDLMAARLLGHFLHGMDASEALANAVGSVEEALEDSQGSDELQLAAFDGWSKAGAWPIEALA